MGIPQILFLPATFIMFHAGPVNGCDVDIGLFMHTFKVDAVNFSSFINIKSFKSRQMCRNVITGASQT
jgi:hypothetical protein